MCDLVNIARGVLQHPSCGLQTKQFDGLGRSTASPELVDSGEVALAHSRLLGQALDGESFVAQVLFKPQVQVLEYCTVFGL
ncbi:hypothetical protein D3C85_1434950 [compost metagenome]